MIWTYQTGVKEEARKTAIDTTRWVIKGRDVPSIRAELQGLLRKSGGHVADLMKVFNLASFGGEEEDRYINDVAFSATMRRCGYHGTQEVLDQAFDSMDLDGNGTISFHELYEFVRGRRHSLDPRTKKDRQGGTHLEPPPGIELDEIAWDIEVLRVLMKQMMERCRISPAELLISWTRGRPSRPLLLASLDRGVFHTPVPIGSRVRIRGGFAETTISDGITAERIGKRGLSRQEFVDEIFRMFFASDDPVIADLWTNQVVMIADATFNEMLTLARGENFFKEIGILHFERWLGAVSKPIPADYAFPLKSKAQLRQQEARRQLGIVIARQMTRREEALDMRRQAIASLGRQSRHASSKELPLPSPPPPSRRPQTAVRRSKKAQQARLRSLSAPKLFQATEVALKPFESLKISTGLPPQQYVERIAAAKAQRKPDWRPLTSSTSFATLSGGSSSTNVLKLRPRPYSAMLPLPPNRGAAESAEFEEGAGGSSVDYGSGIPIPRLQLPPKSAPQQGSRQRLRSAGPGGSASGSRDGVSITQFHKGPIGFRLAP